MLKVEAISKSFSHLKAVDGISLTLQPGMFYGLLGPNGAGKTTTIQMISAIMPPDTGRILVAGMNVYDERSKVKLRMGIVPQEIALYDELTALENLIFWGSLYGVRGKASKQKADELLHWVGLADRKKDKIKTYSGGMKRRINIACALMHDPELILMDEPTVGIDPQSRNKIYELLSELHHNKKTILYTTHYMEEAEKMCDRIGIIDKGKIIAEIRKKGYGKMLVEYVSGYAYKNEYKNLYVVTQEQNRPACQLYESCGFSQIKKEFIYHIWL